MQALMFLSIEPVRIGRKTQIFQRKNPEVFDQCENGHCYNIGDPGMLQIYSQRYQQGSLRIQKNPEAHPHIPQAGHYNSFIKDLPDVSEDLSEVSEGLFETKHILSSIRS